MGLTWFAGQPDYAAGGLRRVDGGFVLDRREVPSEEVDIFPGPLRSGGLPCASEDGHGDGGGLVDGGPDRASDTSGHRLDSMAGHRVRLASGAVGLGDGGQPSGDRARLGRARLVGPRPVGQRVALPPGSQPYGDSDYARNDEPRPQRPEKARPDERQHLAKGYHDEDPRALGESLMAFAHTHVAGSHGSQASATR